MVVSTCVAPVVRRLFVVQHFPSEWQAVSQLYPGFVKEAQNANGFPSHPQVSSAVAVISAGKCRPCLGARARSFSTPLLPRLLLFSFFLKCHLPSRSCPMVILGLTNTKAPVIIAVELGSILAPHGEVYGYKIIQEERCSVFRHGHKHVHTPWKDRLALNWSLKTEQKRCDCFKDQRHLTRLK